MRVELGTRLQRRSPTLPDRHSTPMCAAGIKLACSWHEAACHVGTHLGQVLHQGEEALRQAHQDELKDVPAILILGAAGMGKEQQRKSDAWLKLGLHHRCATFKVRQGQRQAGTVCWELGLGLHRVAGLVGMQGPAGAEHALTRSHNARICPHPC